MAQWHFATFLIDQALREIARTYKVGTVEMLKEKDQAGWKKVIRIEGQINNAVLNRSEKALESAVEKYVEFWKTAGRHVKHDAGSDPF